MGNYLVSLWKGNRPLQEAVILFVLLNVATVIVIGLMSQAFWAQNIKLLMFVEFVWWFFISVAMWRSVDKYQGRPKWKKILWEAIVKVIVVLRWLSFTVNALTVFFPEL